MEESHTAESAVRIEFEQRSRRKPRRPMGCCCCHFAAMSRDDHILAEEALLDAGLAWWRTIRPDGPTISYATTDVPLESVQTKRLFIHTVEYSCGEPKPGAPALVCLHGFGFGIGLYYAAAPALAERWPGRVFCIDLLGCGLSSRPAWPLPYGHRCPLDAAEAYFTDAIEAWRIQLGLDAIALLGHSISGYLAVAYAERHPDHLERLILASPAGVPAPPPGLAEFHAQAPRVMRIVRMLFGRGWSPFFVAKDLGMGERALSGYITRRFGDGLAWIAKPELIKYLTGIWCRTPKSAGGYMHAALLTFGGIPKGSQGEFVYARRPLADRLLSLAERVPRLSCIYGEFDWMFWRNAADVRARQQPGVPPIDVWRVAQATHQQMIDNPLGFVDAVLATSGPSSIPVGAGFGRMYGARAKIFERPSGRALPQDTDYITIWADCQ